MFRNYNRQPDGRQMFRLKDGWAFCSYEKAVEQGWKPSKADLDYKASLKAKKESN